jgi:zinc protease
VPLQFRSFVVAIALVGCVPKNANLEGAKVGAPLPFDPTVRTGTLDNGMRYYIEHNETPPDRAVLRLVFKAGSVLEDDDQRGLAHAVEHLAFNGTRNFPENGIVTWMETIGMRFGAHLNAHTGFDETVYKLQLPTDEKAMSQAFVVLRDWADGITFDPKEIDKERGVVLEEWRTSRGAGGRLRDALIPLTFHGSRYVERLPIGTEDSLKTFTPDQLTRFYRDWYRPDLAAVVVVGDVDPLDIEKRITAGFADWKGPENPRPRPVIDLPTHPETLTSVITDPEISWSTVSAIWKRDDIEGGTVGDYRKTIAEGLVFSILSERLDEAAQSPTAPFLGAALMENRWTPTEGGVVASATAKEGQLVESWDALLVEIERARRYGFLPGEIERARKRYITNMESAVREYGSTPSASHAEELIRAFTNQESVPGIQAELTLAKRFAPEISADELKALMATLYPGRPQVITAQLPQKAGLAAPDEKTLVGKFDDLGTRAIEAPQETALDLPWVPSPPAPGAVTSKEPVAAWDASSWTLSNGVKVIVKKTTFKEDEIALYGWVPGGTGAATEADAPSAETASSIRENSGLGEFSAVALGKRLAGSTAQAYGGIGEDHAILAAGGTQRDLETSLQLLWLLAQRPRFDAEGLTLARQSLEESIKNRAMAPTTVFGDEIRKTWWGDHPRMRPWSAETIAKLDLSKSQAFWQSQFGTVDGMVLVVVGNVDEASLEKSLAQWVASLPVAGKVRAKGDTGARRVKGAHQVKVERGIDPKAAVVRKMVIPYETTLTNRIRAAAAADFATKKLREELREKRGGTYGVSLSPSVDDYPLSLLEWSVEFQCEPTRVDELQKAMAETLTALEKGPEAAELEAVKTTFLREWETAQQSNEGWMTLMVEALQRGVSPDEAMTLPALVGALTPGDLAGGRQGPRGQPRSPRRRADPPPQPPPAAPPVGGPLAWEPTVSIS